MAKAESSTRDHIQEIRSSYAVDSGILERSIFAASLLEAFANGRMPFICKGGTNLLLLLEKPRRVSTDSDIIVEKGTDGHSYLEQTAKIYPFRQ